MNQQIPVPEQILKDRYYLSDGEKEKIKNALIKILTYHAGSLSRKAYDKHTASVAKVGCHNDALSTPNARGYAMDLLREAGYGCDLETEIVDSHSYRADGFGSYEPFHTKKEVTYLKIWIKPE